MKATRPEMECLFAVRSACLIRSRLASQLVTWDGNTQHLHAFPHALDLGYAPTGSRLLSSVGSRYSVASTAPAGLPGQGLPAADMRRAGFGISNTTGFGRQCASDLQLHSLS
jgi:hypothetical protein